MSTYDITFKTEILGELSASILSDLYRVIEKNKISFENKNDFYVRSYYKVLDVKSSLAS